MSVNSQIVEALSLIGAVHNCAMLSKENNEHLDHYDCREDIDKAIEILQQVKEELEYQEVLAR